MSAYKSCDELHQLVVAGHVWKHWTTVSAMYVKMHRQIIEVLFWGQRSFWATDENASYENALREMHRKQRFIAF